MSDPKPVKAPSRHRLALILVVAVYPVITAVLYALGPFTESWHVWQRTFLVAPVMVAAMVYGLIPAVQRNFRRFLTS
jgi:antibiotic biosynthesis monooxygenase (ABM) superfamily enzyme